MKKIDSNRFHDCFTVMIEYSLLFFRTTAIAWTISTLLLPGCAVGESPSTSDHDASVESDRADIEVDAAVIIDGAGPDVSVPETCGNGVLDPGEECDDGDQNSDTEPDACRTDCTLPSCGDGVVDTGEECDDGNQNSDTQPDACRTDCTFPSCGDGVVDTGEECDDGNQNSDTVPNACRTDCTLPSCGDGVVDTGEECDDGNQNSDTQPDACRTDCTLPSCGDGVIDSGEDCDSGNLGGETCVSLGYSGGQLACNNSTCQFNVSNCESACPGVQIGGTCYYLASTANHTKTQAQNICAGLGTGWGLCTSTQVCQTSVYTYLSNNGCSCTGGSNSCNCAMSNVYLHVSDYALSLWIRVGQIAGCNDEGFCQESVTQDCGAVLCCQ